MIAPLSPERYRLQFTVSKETHDTLRRVQDLLCREIPDGDPAKIFARALDLLVHDVAKKKLAAIGRSGRCTARRFLEWHHVQPFGHQGPATVDNISLRCRAHNVYESELVFGWFDPSIVREGAETYVVSREIEPFRNGCRRLRASDRAVG